MDYKLITEKIDYINGFRVVMLRPKLTGEEYDREESKIANKLIKKFRDFNAK